jgi:DNA polymerase family B
MPHAQARECIDKGAVPLNKYVITKQLTKRPDDYPDAKNQPHVQVALRRRASGKRNGVMQARSPPLSPMSFWLMCRTLNQQAPGAPMGFIFNVFGGLEC